MQMQQAMQVLSRVNRDDEWFQAEHVRLEREYGGQYVAVDNGEVIAHAKSIGDLVSGLRKKGKDPSTILVKFVYRKGDLIIL